MQNILQIYYIINNLPNKFMEPTNFSSNYRITGGTHYKRENNLLYFYKEKSGKQELFEFLIFCL